MLLSFVSSCKLMLPKRRFWKIEQSVACAFLNEFSMTRRPSRVLAPVESTSKRTRNALFNLPKSCTKTQHPAACTGFVSRSISWYKTTHHAACTGRCGASGVMRWSLNEKSHRFHMVRFDAKHRVRCCVLCRNKIDRCTNRISLWRTKSRTFRPRVKRRMKT